MIDQKILRNALWWANNAWNAKTKEVEYMGGSEAADAAHIDRCLDAAMPVFERALSDGGMAVGPKFCPHEKHILIEAVHAHFSEYALAPGHGAHPKDDSQAGFRHGRWAPGWRLLSRLRAIWTDTSPDLCQCHEAAKADMTWPNKPPGRDEVWVFDDHKHFGPGVVIPAAKPYRPVLVLPDFLYPVSDCAHRDIVRREHFGPGVIIDVPEEIGGGGRALVGPCAISEIAHCQCGQLIWTARALPPSPDLDRYLIMVISPGEGAIDVPASGVAP